MKTKIIIPVRGAIVFLLALVLLWSCTETQDELSQIDVDKPVSSLHWSEYIQQIESSPAIIVEQNESIQEAINAASAGDAIYIEPGLYSESIHIDKPFIKLIGLNTEKGAPIILESPNGEDLIHTPEGVEIQNVELINYQLDKKNDNEPSSLRIAHKKPFLSMDRTIIEGNIAHYTFEINLGDGKYERIVLHRLIQEEKPYHPSTSDGNIFMVHGANQNFEDIFLQSGSTIITPQTSVATFLASQGIDVWAIDLGWTLIPDEETDFSYMEDWGVDRDTDDILKGMAIARLIRGITHQGFGKLNLLGFSYSAGLTYVAAGKETNEHWLKQDIGGIIPVDGQLVFDPTDAYAIGLSCALAPVSYDNIQNGVFQSKSGVSIFGILASTSPNDVSPIFPWLTNFQAALFLGANIYEFAPVPSDFWHFVGGEYENNIPVGLTYTDEDRWINILATPHSGPYMPEKVRYDLQNCQCDPNNSTLDDHLSDIKIPALYIGSGGGVSSQGFYSIDQLGGTDKTKLIVSFDANPRLDFGHGDLWLAEHASEWVWAPLKDWLQSH